MIVVDDIEVAVDDTVEVKGYSSNARDTTVGTSLTYFSGIRLA